jgi:putative transposase
MSQDHNHLNHATWECKYHVVFTPKYRKKVLFGQIRRHLGTVFHELARRKECKIEEGHLMPDHVHILISIPPKYSVAEVIGYLKGKSSIWVAQNVERKLRNFLGHKLGEGLLRFDRRAGRGDDPNLHQKSGDGGQAVGSAAVEARILIKSPIPHLLSQNPRILHNRLWRFPFKPPALLGVIGLNEILTMCSLRSAVIQ